MTDPRSGIQPEIDPDILAQVIEMDFDGTLIAEVIACFVSDAQMFVAELREIGSLEMLHEGTRLLHTLKSASGCVGARNVTRLSSLLETKAREEGVLPTPEEIEELSATVDAACRELLQLHPTDTACGAEF